MWYFYQAEANIILEMPLREHLEDFIAWHFNSKGQFSVKRTYKLQRHLER